MLAVQCSFCNHENVPGARYCAECGSPLHLRVCPNSNCGKVSDVNAKQCEHCGTFFPEIALAGQEKPVTATEASPSYNRDVAPQTKSQTSPWPLIIVAVVAGGLPLLWINRAYLPAPKGWQTQPESPAVIQPVPVPQAPTPLQPAPVGVSTISPATPDTSTLPPLKIPAQSAASEPETPDTATLPEKTDSSSKQQAAKEPAKQPGKRQKVSEPAAKPTESARPCTEAVAALGLCDPKQAKK